MLPKSRKAESERKVADEDEEIGKEGVGAAKKLEGQGVKDRSSLRTKGRGRGVRCCQKKMAEREGRSPKKGEMAAGGEKIGESAAGDKGVLWDSSCCACCCSVGA